MALIALPDGRYIKTDGTWRVADQSYLAGMISWNRQVSDKRPSWRAVALAPWGDTFAKLKTIANDHDQEALLKAIRKADGSEAQMNKIMVSAFAKSNGEMQSF